MAKEVEYGSVAERFVAERGEKELIAILIATLESIRPGAFEETVNTLFPRADGEPHSATYTKPQ